MFWEKKAESWLEAARSIVLERNGSNLAHMSGVLLRGLLEEEYVVQIYKHELVNHILEHIIDQPLEDGWSESPKGTSPKGTIQKADPLAVELVDH